MIEPWWTKRPQDSEEYRSKYRSFRMFLLFVIAVALLVLALFLGGIILDVVPPAAHSLSRLLYGLFLLHLMTLFIIYVMFKLFVTPPSEWSDEDGGPDSAPEGSGDG